MILTCTKFPTSASGFDIFSSTYFIFLYTFFECSSVSANLDCFKIRKKKKNILLKMKEDLNDNYNTNIWKL